MVHLQAQPTGCCFAAEREIRRQFLEQDLIEAVIGLPQNLFYGAGIPACILIMRPNLTGRPQNPTKPEARRGQVLFINADAEYFAGRAQNYLRPEHVEKVVTAYERFTDLPGYARVVPVAEIAEIADQANDWNLNIRRYVDNAPPPEPQDVRAHLHGGVPAAEVEARRALFAAVGLDPSLVFVGRELDRRPGRDAGTQATDVTPPTGELPRSYAEARTPVYFNFALAGVIATWWTDTLPDFKTLLENGFPGVIDGWVDAIADALEDDDNAGPTFDPFGHKLVRRTMAEYLERIAAARAEIARLKGEKAAFEADNAPDDLDEDELANWNQARDLDRQARELRAELKAALAELKKLETAAKKPPATTGRASSAAQSRLEQARAALAPVVARLAAIAEALEPYEETKADLTEARKRYRALLNDFLAELKAACDAMGEDEKRELVLELIPQDVQTGMAAAMSERRQVLVQFAEGAWDKYRTTLVNMRGVRRSTEERLNAALERLGYDARQG